MSSNNVVDADSNRLGYRKAKVGHRNWNKRRKKIHAFERAA
jgi:hypothetical protein